MPKDKVVNINNNNSNNNNKRLPLIGTPNTKYPSSNTTIEITKARKIYGITLAMMICIGFMGDASKTSIVPSSFSRVSEIEVIIAVTSINIIVIKPGTNRNTPFKF